MTKYHNDHENLCAYVVTTGDPISAMRAVLQNSLDCQSEVTAIHEATYMGKVIVPNAPDQRPGAKT